MELVLTTDDEENIAKIIMMADELGVKVEQRGLPPITAERREAARNRLLNFKPLGPSSI